MRRQCVAVVEGRSEYQRFTWVGGSSDRFFFQLHMFCKNSVMITKGGTAASNERMAKPFFARLVKLRYLETVSDLTNISRRFNV